MSKFEYYNNCVSWDSSDAEGLEEVIDNAEEITYQEMIQEVSLEDLMEQFPFYEEMPITMEQDWSVKYFKSTLHGEPCVYVQHSATEYVFKLSL